MPLLKRKAFEKSTVSEYLRDDDEVFHCEITDEIFKDYEEYCERIILVNSMVWSCEMTGKNNLTYSEALDSEKAARKSLRDFPIELRIPILYLASLTKRSSFAEMSEDVFNFVRERYFVGETVEACLEGDQWRESHVLSVTAQKQLPGSTATLPATSYCYEVEQFEESDEGGQIGSAPHDRVRRRKGVYTRDKNRLFLKQFVQQGPAGVICIKQTAIEKYNINKVQFDQIFIGNPPEFAPSKKLLKTSPTSSKTQSKPGSATKLNKSTKKPTPDKKGRQESMDKFLKKTDKTEPIKPKPPVDPAAKKSAQELAEKMRRAEDQMRQRKEEEKAKKKEKHARLQAYLKEWQKIKDDLELEDHKVIPKGTPIEIEGIPQTLVGEFFSVLEFVSQYGDILKVKDVFHNGLDIETFRKALTLKESAGSFSDLVQMFMTTIFSLQEDEAEEYNEEKGIQEFNDDKQLQTEVGMTQAVELATKASKWSQTYLGTPLSKLPLDPSTVSEVLRLHFLSSGAAGGSRCATWRYQQRGGYSSHDDPGLRLRLNRPDLLAKLSCTHVADLSTDDKFQIIQCLMNQLLTYATLRDVIEEKLEEYKIKKHTLRTLQINERKREVQLIAARQELKKEYTAKKEEEKLTGEKAKQADEELQSAIEKLNKESEMKKIEYEKKVKELQVELFEHTTYIGSDRAYRRYWVCRRTAGILVEAGSEPRGICRDKPVPHRKQAPDLLAHVAALYDDHHPAGSDKENDSDANSRGNSPKKPLNNLNGINHKLAELDDASQQLRELMVCTGNIETCFAHGKSDFRPRWWVYHTEEQIEALIQSLNKRGLRENELRQNLEMDKPRILDLIKKCPVHLLNPTVASPPQVHTHGTRLRKTTNSLTVAADATLSETLELLLRDHILELEEKIHHGCLGALKVKDREAWRGTLMLRGYDKQAEYLTWGPNNQYRDDYHLPNGVLNIPNGLNTDGNIPINKYRDPAHYLDATRVNGARSVANSAVSRSLACALLQVEQAIHHKYLKRPLGLDDKERKEREAKNKSLDLDALERWEVSLMECQSFAQIALHLFTLDSSITWSASILNACCRLCRRKTDPDNMLLCDGCNKGHHLYCLKPKLSKVPDGDWFCEQCKPKERTPRKRRKLFSDDDVDEDELDDSFVSAVCAACGSGGRMSSCSGCGARLHAECGKKARSTRRALCPSCCDDNVRDSEDSEYNTVLVKLKTKKNKRSKEKSPKHNGATKRSYNKSKDETTKTSRRSKNTSLTNGVHDERAGRKRSSRHEPKLHTEALEQLLREVTKHKDCWPFSDPVSTEEVPDYLDIIDEPMDFSTIKCKLEEEQYTTDEELLADIVLVFRNCYVYNQDTHPVARAGYRLEKYISRRCQELELPELPEIVLEEEETASKRRKSSDDNEAPIAKKAKLK